MLTDYKHQNHHLVDTYTNVNNKINFKYKKEYTLILDNMRCNLKKCSKY